MPAQLLITVFNTGCSYKRAKKYHLTPI